MKSTSIPYAVSIKEVSIKVEEWDRLPFLHDRLVDSSDVVYDIEGSSNLKEHKYDLEAMKDMFDLKFGELFPGNAKP